MARYIALAVVLVLARPGFAEDPLKDFDKRIAQGLKEHRVPGIGLAIIKDGKVIHVQGYGVKTLGKEAAVTADTLFAIGSITKSFTAASLAMLVDEGKLSWDTPLSQHLESFVLKESYRTQELTLRDALTHRTGYARNDMIWYGSPFDRAALIKRLRKIEPEHGFRSQFVYNNLMYMAAGQMIPAATSKKTPWDEFVEQRIFQPLGMKTANTSISKLPKDGDVATPHERVKGVPAPVEWRNIDNIGPAGSINASARDMAQYVMFQLAKGKAGDKRLVKSVIFQEMHKPQIVMPTPGFSFSPDSLHHAYGMGWMLSDYKGEQVVEHGGNIDGMTALVGMMPGKKLGVVILANRGGSILPMAMMYDIFDRYLGLPDENRIASSAVLSSFTDFAINMVADADETKRIKGTKPSLPLEKYEGKFQDQKHAELVVKYEKEKLWLTFNGMHFELEHWHHNTFRGLDKKGILPKLLFTFVLDSDARVSEIHFKLVPTEDIKMLRIKS